MQFLTYFDNKRLYCSKFVCHQDNKLFFTLFSYFLFLFILSFVYVFLNFVRMLSFSLCLNKQLFFLNFNAHSETELSCYLVHTGLLLYILIHWRAVEGVLQGKIYLPVHLGRPIIVFFFLFFFCMSNL